MADIPGRGPIWKQWDEAPVLAGKFKSGEGERFQGLLANIADSGHDAAADAWYALAGFAITSPNPGALTMTMLGLAADGISYGSLAACLLVSRSSGRPLARVLRDYVADRAAARVVVVEMPDTYAGTDRDWRSKIRAAPDPVPRPYEIHNREWRSSDQRPSVRY
jgi:hypothetical protein